MSVVHEAIVTLNDPYRSARRSRIAPDHPAPNFLGESQTVIVPIPLLLARFAAGRDNDAISVPQEATASPRASNLNRRGRRRGIATAPARRLGVVGHQTHAGEKTENPNGGQASGPRDRGLLRRHERFSRGRANGALARATAVRAGESLVGALTSTIGALGHRQSTRLSLACRIDKQLRPVTTRPTSTTGLGSTRPRAIARGSALATRFPASGSLPSSARTRTQPHAALVASQIADQTRLLGHTPPTRLADSGSSALFPTPRPREMKRAATRLRERRGQRLRRQSRRRPGPSPPNPVFRGSARAR